MSSQSRLAVTKPHKIFLTLIVTAIAVATGCDRFPSSSSSEATQTPRVVSLAPALTQMIVDMGQAGLLVATSERDPAAPPGLPVVGHFQDINTEALLAANPTHVLTMTGKKARIPGYLKRLARSGKFRLVSYPSPEEITEVSKILFDEQEMLLGKDASSGKCLGLVLDAPTAALRVAMRMGVRLANLRNAVADESRQRVLMVIGVNPFMASGPGTTHDQLLSFCGGINAAGDATVGAPVYDKEKLITANPDVVLMLLPGAPPLGSIESDPRLAVLRGLPVLAVQKGRIVLVDDPLVHLPSSSLDRIGQAMAKAIHPSAADAIDQAMRQGLPASEAATPIDKPIPTTHTNAERE